MCIFCNAKERRKVGEFLGYPKCCIDWDENYQKEHGTGIEHFTQEQLLVGREYPTVGFIPCPECSTKVVKGEIEYEDLVDEEARKCSAPFPLASLMAHTPEGFYLKEELETYLNNRK